MRGIALVVAFLLVVIALYLAYVSVRALGSGRAERLRRQATWQVRHYNDGGRTVVAIGLTAPTGTILDEQVVARVPDADADWQSRFLAAKQEAEERAFHLNAD